MAKTITKKIENLLTLDSTEPVESVTESPQNYFSEKIKLELNQKQNFTEENFKLLENISYFSESSLDWKIFFSRLIPFFEMGFYFENKNLCSMFMNGKMIDNSKAKKTIQLPNSPLFNILKTSGDSFLQKLQLSHVVSAGKSDCLYVRVSDTPNEVVSFALITSLAEPWLELKVDSLSKALLSQAGSGSAS